MNQWYAAMALLALMQIWFYRIDPKKMARAAIFYWGAVYLGLLGCEFARKLLAQSQIEWWISVMACLIAVMIGETAQVLSLSVMKTIDKKRQVLPSFFSFSVLYLAFVWLSLNHAGRFDQSQIEIITIASLSLFFTIILSGIEWRLTLYEIPKPFRSLPILAISAALFLLIFLR